MQEPWPHRRVFGVASLSTQIIVMAAGGWGQGAAATIDVGLTDQTLSCAARALVTTAERHAACLHLNCRDADGVTPSKYPLKEGGSAAGPKPGRDSFYGELAGHGQVTAKLLGIVRDGI